MKKRLLLILAVLLAIGGLCFLFYPTYKTAMLRKAEQDSIAAFERYRETAPVQVIPSAADEQLQTEPPNAEAEATEPCSAQEEPMSGTKRQEPARIFPELWAACCAYNEQLPQTQRASYSAESLRRPSLQLSDYVYEQDVFGYISIPTAEIEVPIYLGANDANLNKGAAVLGQTSLPIGGENTNCVIAGHRTWNGAIQFKGLEQLQPGDKVYVTNPWETLTYQVVETKTILPDAMQEVLIQEGRDLLTIFTCTSPNSHRYLVICERVNESSEDCSPLVIPFIL